MPKESFLMYFSFEDTFRNFTLEERSEMLFAFFEYNRTGSAGNTRRSWP